MNGANPIEIEIMVPRDDKHQLVRIVRAFTVPSVGECIVWGGKYKVKIVQRDWILDKDAGLAYNLRCVLFCEKIVWPD
jgi:hypothetical protein